MSPRFLEILRGGAAPQMNEDQVSLWARYRDLVVEASAQQNLTKLLSPVEFFEGHVIDVLELSRSGLVEYPAADLGSGVGIPGLGMGILGSGPWIIVESELRKAEFLARAASELQLATIQEVRHARIETFLSAPGASVGSVVARAVGPVARIYEWIRKCSTWNNLILLKGPGWPEEWAAFQRSPRRKELIVAGEHHYSFEGADGQTRSRRVVKLVRTKK